jgi:cob(I)alamin adenosyltransferase
MKIYSRTGDSGKTALFGGGRVDKDHPRVAAYGDVDELNAAIGSVMAEEPDDFERELLESIQRDLFSIGGQLASPDPKKVAAALEKAALSQDRVDEFERAIDREDRTLEPLKAFVLPGGTRKAAALHRARTVCRRAERSVVALHHHERVSDEILKYLNRLSDLLFTLARSANHRAGVSDRTW